MLEVEAIVDKYLNTGCGPAWHLATPQTHNSAAGWWEPIAVKSGAMWVGQNIARNANPRDPARGWVAQAPRSLAPCCLAAAVWWPCWLCLVIEFGVAQCPAPTIGCASPRLSPHHAVASNKPTQSQGIGSTSTSSSFGPPTRDRKRNRIAPDSRAPPPLFAAQICPYRGESGEAVKMVGDAPPSLPWCSSSVVAGRRRALSSHPSLKIASSFCFSTC